MFGGGNRRPATPAEQVRRLLWMLALLAVPAGIALSTIDVVRPKLPPVPQHSELGYTWSLLFFVLPTLVLLSWFWRHPNRSVNQRSFWIALGFLFGLGAGLDFFFGTTFFTFVNRGAVLGIDVPVVGGSVPIEEFGFYSFGFAAILLVYLWVREEWIPGAPGFEHRPASRMPLRDTVSIHWTSILLGLGLFLAAWGWKRFGPHGNQEGFPGYFLFLLIVGVLPNVLFFRAVGPRIDWPALSFTMVLLLPVSLLWEGVLASPYQWWGYRPEMMMGIDVDALSGLPVEAVLLWFVAAWAGVTIFEVCRLVQGVHPCGEDSEAPSAADG